LIYTREGFTYELMEQLIWRRQVLVHACGCVNAHPEPGSPQKPPNTKNIMKFNEIQGNSQDI